MKKKKPKRKMATVMSEGCDNQQSQNGADLG